VRRQVHGQATGASQGWRTFLHNHAPEVAAMDFFVVPTIGFDLLYAFVIVRLASESYQTVRALLEVGFEPLYD
jgi:hypothetical protein